MGLDFSFITVIHKNDKEKMYEYIRNNGSLSYGNCASIHFDMDSFILKYLEGGYDWKPHFDRAEIEKHIEPDGKASIGCIYIKERKLPRNEIEFSFTAATTDMSLLFKDSVSISRWFVKLSAELNAIITYLDKEDDGVRIIYYKGFQFQLDIRSESHLGDVRDSFLNMIQDFSHRYEHFEN